MIRKLDFLLYVDERYVESVYNFYYPNIVETIEGKTRNKRKRFSLTGKLIKNFPIDISSDGEIGFDNVTIKESKIHPSIERKVLEVIKNEFENSPIALLDILNNIQENGIYYFQGVFELISIENKNGKDIICNKGYRNNPKGLVWKLKLVPYNKSNANVSMAMGGDNILLSYHHLTEEIEKYKRFTFNVLGKVTKFSEQDFTIKPIVVFYL